MTPKEIIYQAIGEASMCWENTPTSVFDSTRAKEIGDRLWNHYEALESRIKKLEAVAEAAMDALDHVKQYDSREFGTIGRLGQHVNTILERINKLLDDAVGG